MDVFNFSFQYTQQQCKFHNLPFWGFVVFFLEGPPIELWYLSSFHALLVFGLSEAANKCVNCCGFGNVDTCSAQNELRSVINSKFFEDVDSSSFLIPVNNLFFISIDYATLLTSAGFPGYNQDGFSLVAEIKS